MTFSVSFRLPQRRALPLHFSPAQFNFRRRFLSSTTLSQGENHE
jgi:hypothetical protein